MPITLPVALLLLVLGLGIGSLSGLVGIGGGVVRATQFCFFKNKI
jgi:uncharacterized membrane protein YfcA